ncbi:MAG: aldehyde-activating protein [Pseudomonadota bacterium]
MTNTCACGSVTVTIKKKPDYIYDCDCNLCRKSGAAWGYFASDEVNADGRTIAFARRDKSIPIVEIHSCAICGSTTHFTLTDTYQTENPDVDQVGVNMRLFDPDQLDGVQIQYPNGSAWSGEGPFGFRREPVTLSSDTPW